MSATQQHRNLSVYSSSGEPRLPASRGDISNDVGRVKRHVARSGRQSRLSSAKVGGGGRVPVARAASVSILLCSNNSCYGRCCPPNISSVTRDHDDYANSLRGGGLPTHFAGHVVRPTTSPHRHSRIRASPRCRRRQCATAELVVVDLIAQQDPQSDAQLSRHRDACLSEPFLLELPPIKSA